jgi:hypothetical protein
MGGAGGRVGGGTEGVGGGKGGGAGGEPKWLGGECKGGGGAGGGPLGGKGVIGGGGGVGTHGSLLVVVSRGSNERTAGDSSALPIEPGFHGLSTSSVVRLVRRPSSPFGSGGLAIGLFDASWMMGGIMSVVGAVVSSNGMLPGSSWDVLWGTSVSCGSSGVTSKRATAGSCGAMGVSSRTEGVVSSKVKGGDCEGVRAFCEEVLWWVREWFGLGPGGGSLLKVPIASRCSDSV